MPIAQGECPNCGAPIQFSVGASIACICASCRSTVLRTDRGLEDCGQVAALADTPAPLSVGDRATLAGRAFEVVGRIQYDYGLGPWDEYYIAFENGSHWGWLAYAQGRWYETQLVPNLAAPPREQLTVDSVRSLPIGRFNVTEIRSARVVSAEGELPSAATTGSEYFYADAYGPGGKLPGGPGPLPTQGSHGPGRASFWHPVRQVTALLRGVELSVRLAVTAKETPAISAASTPNSAMLHVSDGATT